MAATAADVDPATSDALLAAEAAALDLSTLGVLWRFLWTGDLRLLLVVAAAAAETAALGVVFFVGVGVCLLFCLVLISFQSSSSSSSMLSHSSSYSSLVVVVAAAGIGLVLGAASLLVGCFMEELVFVCVRALFLLLLLALADWLVADWLVTDWLVAAVSN